MEKSVSAPTNRLIRVKELRSMLGNPSLSTIYRWVSKGILPEPRRISPRFVAWRFSDIEALLKEKGADND